MDKLAEREMQNLHGGGDGTWCGIAVGFTFMMFAISPLFGMLAINKAIGVCILDIAT